MELIKLTSCKRLDFDFKPLKKWPLSWPAFAWENKIIAGFRKKHPQALNFTKKDSDFLSLFYSCYPDLNLMEMARIFHNENFKETFKEDKNFWPNFFTLYDLKQDISLIKNILNFLIKSPQSFQNWMEGKKLQISDLRIVNSLKPPKTLYSVCEYLAQKNISQALAVQILELTGELILMEHSPEKILQALKTSPPENSIEQIECLRKPKALSQDLKKQKQIAKNLWPPQVQAKWRRIGDQGGLEIKLWSANQEDFQKKIKKISSNSLINKLF